ncbi:hypothetical protein E2C01_091563 [Portunus trituberculatus]|uniref:Uncharacterized protein n=1 Tax=Portunus trituberculatus TaxID=210409 RepID=A0A5B7JJD2_PORTR|nr:hypothetical protein [Portunus trituberculatus]
MNEARSHGETWWPCSNSEARGVRVAGMSVGGASETQAIAAPRNDMALETVASVARRPYPPSYTPAPTIAPLPNTQGTIQPALLLTRAARLMGWQRSPSPRLAPNRMAPSHPRRYECVLPPSL